MTEAEKMVLAGAVSQAWDQFVGGLCNALRQIKVGAMDIEHGEENPREAAQDIQRLCYAALNNHPLPQIWKLEEPEER